MAKKDNNRNAKQSGTWQKVTPPKKNASPSKTPVQSEKPDAEAGKDTNQTNTAKEKVSLEKSKEVKNATIKEDSVTKPTDKKPEQPSKKEDTESRPTDKKPEQSSKKAEPKSKPKEKKSDPDPKIEKKQPRRQVETKREDTEFSRNSISKRSSAAVPIGGIFVVLAIIGLITVIMFSIRATEQLIDNSSEKERFESIILPVLMFDPVPFEDPSEISEVPLLRSCIWSAIIGNIDKYTFSDGSVITLPKSDVDVACARLFGSKVSLKHQAFEDGISLYSYDKDTQSYYVPVDASILYTPKVQEITKKDDIYSLVVGYIAPDNQWMMSIKGEKSEPTPSKYMIYNLKKVDKHYQLVAIKDPPEGAVPGVPQIQPQESLGSETPGTPSTASEQEITIPVLPETASEVEPASEAESASGDGVRATEEKVNSKTV